MAPGGWRAGWERVLGHWGVRKPGQNGAAGRREASTPHLKWQAARFNTSPSSERKFKMITKHFIRIQGSLSKPREAGSWSGWAEGKTQSAPCNISYTITIGMAGPKDTLFARQRKKQHLWSQKGKEVKWNEYVHETFWNVSKPWHLGVRERLQWRRQKSDWWDALEEFTWEPSTSPSSLFYAV